MNMPRKLQPYEPRPQDLNWAKQVIQRLPDGGTVATSAGDYLLDHGAKTVTLVAPADPMANPITLFMHHRAEAVWGRLGYAVLPSVRWADLELPDREAEEWEKQNIPPDVWSSMVRQLVDKGVGARPANATTPVPAAPAPEGGVSDRPRSSEVDQVGLGSSTAYPDVGKERTGGEDPRKEP
jgi:hypothetical protein